MMAAARRTSRSSAAIVKPLPAALLVLAALVVAAEALAVNPRIVAIIAALLPVDIAAPDPTVAAATAFGLAALAVALRRGKRLAWWLAVATFTSGLIAQALLLGHPVGALVAAVCLLFLAADRVSYRTRSDVQWRRRFVILLVVGLVAALVESVVGLVASGEWGREAFDPGDFLVSVVSWFAFGDPASTIPVGPGAVIALLPLAARLPVVLGLFGLLQPCRESPLDPALREHAERVTRRFGRGALLPFQLGRDKLRFTLPGSDGSVVYGRAGRMAVVLGDPIGPEGEAWRVFDGFLEECALTDHVPCVYQASSSARPTLIAAGFRTFRIGREAIIDLASFSLAGSRRANLRHTVTRAQRGGVRTEWHADGLGEVDRGLAEQLVEIDTAWSSQAGPRLGFTINQFDLADLASQPVAIAVDADARVLAFATFRSTGGDGGFVLDLLRRRPGSVPGAMEACLVEAAERLRDEGVPALSLGLAPLSGLRRDGSIEERLLAVASRFVRPLYDVRGLEFFKGKFDPIWEPRYAAVRQRRDLLGLAEGLIRLHLGSSPGSMLRAGAEALPHLVAGLLPGRRRAPTGT